MRRGVGQKEKMAGGGKMEEHLGLRACFYELGRGGYSRLGGALVMISRSEVLVSASSD